MFQGFTPETVDFLWGIRLNNNREWFTENKKQYTDTLYEPMKALAKELQPLFADMPGTLVKVSRIYRDARMHHPVPYKESLWVCIRQETEWWAENGCLFFEITPDGIEYGFFIWQPKPATMEAFRRYIAAKPDEFLSVIRQVEASTGLKVQAECYKRPKPCDNDDLLPFFAWKGKIGCTVHEKFSEATFGPGLENRVADLFRKLLPLYDFFNKFKA